MKLSTKGRYAVTAMMSLAINDNSGPVTLTDISSSQSISLSYLEQLFSMLRKAGLVQGVRGPGGGYRLGKTPNLINIAEIVNAVEGSPDNQSSKLHSDVEECITHHLWNELSDQLNVFLSSITLADFIKDQTVRRTQVQLDETTRRISTMFPVSAKMKVA